MRMHRKSIGLIGPGIARAEIQLDMSNVFATIGPPAPAADIQDQKEVKPEIVALLVPFLTWFSECPVASEGAVDMVKSAFLHLHRSGASAKPTGEIMRPTQTLHTASIKLMNIGRESATDIELVFNWKPLCLKLWPV